MIQLLEDHLLITHLDDGVYLCLRTFSKAFSLRQCIKLSLPIVFLLLSVSTLELPVFHYPLAHKLTGRTNLIAASNLWRLCQLCVSVPVKLPFISA